MLCLFCLPVTNLTIQDAHSWEPEYVLMCGSRGGAIFIIVGSVCPEFTKLSPPFFFLSLSLWIVVNQFSILMVRVEMSVFSQVQCNQIVLVF